MLICIKNYKIILIDSYKLNINVSYILPKKVVLDDLKKIYRESDSDRTLDKFVKKLELKEIPNFLIKNRKTYSLSIYNIFFYILINIFFV